MGLFWQGWWSARSVVVVEVNGYEIGPKARLTKADLAGTDLAGDDLERAVLVQAELSEASLPGVNLRQSDIRWANLSRADVSESNVPSGPGGTQMTNRLTHRPSSTGWAPIACAASNVLLLQVNRITW